MAPGRAPRVAGLLPLSTIGVGTYASRLNRTNGQHRLRSAQRSSATAAPRPRPHTCARSTPSSASLNRLPPPIPTHRACTWTVRALDRNADPTPRPRATALTRRPSHATSRPPPSAG